MLPDKRKPRRGGPGLQSDPDQQISLRDKPQTVKIQANPLTWFAAAFFGTDGTDCGRSIKDAAIADDWVHIPTAAATEINKSFEILAQRAPKATAVERQHTDTRQRVTKQQPQMQMQMHMQQSRRNNSMPNISEYYSGEFLKCEDLKNQDAKVTIDKVEERDFENDRAKLVLSFRGKDKLLILNKTNAKCIARFCGNATEDWPAMTLFCTRRRSTLKAITSMQSGCTSRHVRQRRRQRHSRQPPST